MKIKSCIVRDVCYRRNDPDEFLPYKEWNFIESKITYNDTNDGGAGYEAIMQNKATGQFYRADYNDWDFYWEYSDWKEDDDNEESSGRSIDDESVMEIYPVKAKQVTITTYE